MEVSGQLHSPAASKQLLLWMCNDSVSNVYITRYISSNDWGETIMSENLEGDGTSLFHDVPEFAWRDWGNPRITSGQDSQQFGINSNLVISLIQTYSGIATQSCTRLCSQDGNTALRYLGCCWVCCLYVSLSLCSTKHPLQRYICKSEYHISERQFCCKQGSKWGREVMSRLLCGARIFPQHIFLAIFQRNEDELICGRGRDRWRETALPWHNRNSS